MKIKSYKVIVDVPNSKSKAFIIEEQKQLTTTNKGEFVSTWF